MTDKYRREPDRFIEPGSKEDAELTEALTGALDEIERANKDQHQLARQEVERKRREGIPLDGDCYFVRFTGAMPVRDEDLDELWDQDKIAVHLPGGAEAPDAESLDPALYPLQECPVVRILKQLSERGGYVWFENRSRVEAKVGVVRPDTPVRNSSAVWASTAHSKHKGKAGTETTLRTLLLEKVRPLGAEEAMILRAARPVVEDYVSLKTLVRWRPSSGEARLAALVEGKPKRIGWEDLPPDLQATVCVEFLRHHRSPDYPRLVSLLLPTSTRSEDVDVYGLAEDVTEILAQVPFLKNRAKGGYVSKKKAARLKKYEGPGRNLVCFYPSSGHGAGNYPPVDIAPSLFGWGVKFVAVEEVLEWIETQPGYGRRLFSV